MTLCVCVCYEYNANHKAHNTYCATFLSSPLNILYVQCELETTTSTHNITFNKFAIEIFLSRLSFSFDDAFFVKKINRNQFLSIREGKKRWHASIHLILLWEFYVLFCFVYSNSKSWAILEIDLNNNNRSKTTTTTIVIFMRC